METMIIVFQTLCVAGLVLGSVLSFTQLMQRSSRNLQRFSYAAANDFETDFRRLARNSR